MNDKREVIEQISEIVGLGWETNWRIPNGLDSYVVPFPTLNPMNIVFHGDAPFEHGHYGIHLGTEDRLIFLGAANRIATGFFIDCRHGSPSLHKRAVLNFRPGSDRTLHIPAGVAHCFKSLEGIYTLNAYQLFLPSPQRWLSGETDWSIESDIINLPMNIADADLPTVIANECEASDLFYQLLASNQRESLADLEYEYPFTEKVKTADGQQVTLKIRKKIDEVRKGNQWMPISAIDGAGWTTNLSVMSGPEAGFVPLLNNRPVHLIDHGEREYSHDAYGLHRGAEDHLIFVGPTHQKIRLSLVDCRTGSKTLHNSTTVEFSPSPLHCLNIPNGVAHRFEHLENIFTFNCPSIHVEDEDSYDYSNDVTDIPVDTKRFPEIAVERHDVSSTYYHRVVAAQRELIANPPTHSMPVILMALDADGRQTRVALRKPI